MSGFPVRLIAAFHPGENGQAYTPTGLLMVAAALREVGVEVELVDLQVELEPQADPVKVLTSLIREGPRLVGISVMCDGLPFVVAAADAAKREAGDKIIVLGGPGVRFVAPQVVQRFPSIDCVVVGEGEVTSRELFPLLAGSKPGDAPAQALCGVHGIVYRDGDTVVETPARAPVEDLDTLPLPALDTLSLDRYTEFGFTASRGCPFRCSFCTTTQLWGQSVRRYSPERTAQIFEQMVAATGGKKSYSFFDDTFTSRDDATDAVCRALRARRLNVQWNCLIRVNNLRPQTLHALSEAGCTGVSIGVESGSQRVLDRMNKGIRLSEATEGLQRAGECMRELTLFFIWGFPFEGVVDLRQTLTLMQRLGMVLPPRVRRTLGLSLLSPLPGSPIREEYQSALKFDWHLYHEFGGLAKQRYQESRKAMFRLQDLLMAHPDIFSGFYCIDHPALAAKIALMTQAKAECKAAMA